MTQIDLISNEWSDLLFENRNKEYGAYVLRHQTGTRNIMSILAVLIILALAMVSLVAKNAYDGYRATHIRHEEVVVLTDLPSQKPEPKVERAEPIKQEEIENVLEKVRGSIKFTAPVIKNDQEVNPEDEMKSQDEIMSSKLAISVFNVIGNDENGEVLRIKTRIGHPHFSYMYITLCLGLSSISLPMRIAFVQ